MFFLYLIVTQFTSAIIYGALTAFVVATVIVAFKIYQKEKLAKSSTIEIDKMSGENFEKYLESFFRKQGYRV